jgi:exonuclease VII small subunit
MFVMESVDDLWNHIAYVLAYAPDKFPYRDFLSDEDQMTLELAFKQLREGVMIAYPEDSFASKRDELNEILDRSLEMFRNGNEIAAGHELNNFEGQIFKR